MKTYSLDSKLLYVLYVVVMPVIFLVVGAFILWTSTHGTTDGHFPVWIGVIWLAMMAWGIYRTSSMPHTIQVTNTGTIRFVGIFRSFAVEPGEVTAIRGRGQMIEIRHAHGKIFILNQVTGLHEFLSDLQRVNPAVQIRGA
ncbi:MAG TPA: hypothetical protein VFK13_08775 [Gemmatimonadaceae bacterium]|nr:hypothetical protein [Gemmatimonadaceae bacterium]